MSNKPTKVLFKRNSTANTPPTADKLVPGEIALNTADGKIFLKKDDNTIVDTSKQIFNRNTNVTVNDDGTNPGYVVTNVDGSEKFRVDPSSATLNADMVMVGGKVVSLYDLANSGKVSLAAPASVPLDYTLRLPELQGKAGQVMAVGANNQLEFVAPDRFGGNRVYVSADRGDDANDGINAPVASVKRACQIASQLIYEHTGTPADGSENARALLFANRDFVKAEVAAWINYNYVNFNSHYDSATCERDIGLIIDAVYYDVVTGSNLASTTAGRSYYRIQSALVPGRQLIQTLAALTYAKTESLTYVDSSLRTALGLAFDNVSNILANGVSASPAITFPNDAATVSNGTKAKNILQANRSFFQAEILAYIKINYPSLVIDEAVCTRDVGYITDAVSYDLMYGGNYQTIIAAKAYYSYAILEIQAGEVAATLATYNYLASLMASAIVNTAVTPLQILVSQNTSLPVSNSTYANSASTLVGQVITTINTGTAPSTTYPTVPASGTLKTSFDSLQAGKNTIQSGVTTYITNTFSSFTYGTLGTTAGAAKSARDSGLILDGAIFDMFFTGNEKSREYGLSFYNGTATYLLANEKTICVQALTYARDIAKKITTNTLVASPYQTVVTQVRDSVNYGTSTNANLLAEKFDIAIAILNTGTDPGVSLATYRIRGVSVRIAPGNYFENNPIIVPDNVSIIGDDLRSAVVRPLNANKDIFRIRNGVYMNGFTFRDHVNPAGVPDYTWRYTHAFDDVDDYEVTRDNYTWVFNSKPLITQSPYIQNCSIISFLGGSGCLIDGSKVVSPNKPKNQIESENPVVGDAPEQGKSMVGNAYTMLSFGGTGWQVINDAYSQIVGCFQIFLLNGIYAQSGGYISVTNSATNFGGYALRASGYSSKSFSFDRGYIADTGTTGGAQTITVIGMQRIPLIQYVLRAFDQTTGNDVTNSFKASPTIIGFNAATALTLGSSTFTISNHGLFTGNTINYSRNGNVEINGLSDNGIYYVQVANINQFNLFNDSNFQYPARINAPGTGTHQLIKNPEEFYINDILSSHSTYQKLTLASSSYTFEPGRVITGTVDVYTANAYVYSWNSSTRELIISNEYTNIGGTNERVKFTAEANSTIDSDHATPVNAPPGGIAISSVVDYTGLWTATIFPKSTIEGGLISSISGLQRKRVAFHRPSIVNSSAHTWEYAGSGTDYNALPQNGGVPKPENEQYSEAPGRVYVSGTNELGDFKVGNFIVAENRSGLITFKSKVTVGELNVLKLTLSAVAINQISADVGLGDNEPGGASNQRLSTQKAVRSFFANRLGSVIDKSVSTNSVPGALVQLNASGQINADLLPPQKAATTYQVDTWKGRLSLYNKIPPVDVQVSDQANERYQQRTLTLSGNVTAAIGQIVTQSNRTGTGVVKYVVTGTNTVTIANSAGTFTTNTIDTILFDGVNSEVYPSNTGSNAEQSETYYLAQDNKSQFLVLATGAWSFTNGNTVVAAKSLAQGQITEYRPGVLYGVDNTGIAGGSGYQPAIGSVLYTNVPLVSTGAGTGTGAIADITVTSGAVTNVAVNFGGSGYAVGDVLSASTGNIGGGFPTATFTVNVSRADSRLYVDLTGNNIKFSSPDYIQDNNATTSTIADLTYYLSKSFNASSIAGGGNVDYSNSRITVTSHGFTNGDPVVYSAGVNIAIGNLTSNSTYFAKVINSDTVELYSNYNLANKLTFGLSQTGTHTLRRYAVNTENFFFALPSHGFTTGTPIKVVGTTPPGGINSNSYFYVGSVTTNAFSLHLSRADALSSINGSTINQYAITSTGAGSLNLTTQNVLINSTLNTSSKSANNWNNLTATTIDAAAIVSGTVSPTRLANNGTANNQTFLRGDSSWAYATASAKAAADSPLTITGDFDTRSGINYYHGDLTFDVNKVNPLEGGPNFTNYGVAAFAKSQFTVLGGTVTITAGAIDAGTLGGFTGSYYLTPDNFQGTVPITKGGTNLTTYTKGDLLYSSSNNTLAPLNIGSTGQVLNVDISGIPQWSDSVNLPGSVTVQSTTQSNGTTSGSIKTAGGLGIAKNANIGGNLNVDGNIVGTGSLTVNSTDKSVSLQPTGTGTVVVYPSTKGTIDNMDVGSTVAGSAKFTTLEASGNTKVTANTSSTTTGTGALVVSGGLGVGENLNVHGNTVIGGNLTVNGTTTTVNSTTTTIQDPMIDIGGGIGGIAPSTNDNKDRGIKFQWHNGTVAKTGFFGYKSADGFLEFIPDASITGDVATGSLGDIKAATFRGNLTSSSVTITGGTINNTTIGATNATSGAFTTLTSNGATTFTANTSSVDTTTGTLVITGGVGISGAVNIGGAINTGAATVTRLTDSALTSGRVTYAAAGGELTDSNNLRFNGTTLTTVNGSFTGTLGVTGDLTVNTNKFSVTATTGDTSVAGTLGVTGATTLSSTLGVTGAVTLSDVTQSTNTTTGALKVAGGVGVAKNVWVGGTLNAGATTVSSLKNSALTAMRVVFAGTDGLLTDTADLTYNSFGQLSTYQLIVNSGAEFKSNVSVRQLTIGRVTFAGADQTLSDSSNLTFDNATGKLTGLQISAGDLTATTSVTFNTSGTVTINPSTAGAIDNVIIGANTAKNGTFTNLTANTSASLSPTGLVTINPGTTSNMDNVIIGATTAKAGTFTALTVNTSASLSPTGTVTLNPGTTSTIDNMSIGATTRSSGAFTTLAANNTVSFTSTTDSSSSTGGAVIISGGVGIAKNLNVGGSLAVNSTTTFTGSVTTNGAVNLNPANANVSIAPTGTGIVTINPGSVGTLDNVTIGASTARAATFTALTATGNTNFNGNNSTISLSPTGSGYVTINPTALGSIDNMTVGATTASTGRFTTLTATTSANFSPTGTVTLNPTTASSINNMSIGASTRSSGAFTTLTSNGATTFTAGTASSSTTSGSVVVTGGVGVSENLYVGGLINAGAATFTSVTNSGLTAGRVTFAGTSGLLSDSSSLTYASGTLTVGTSVVAGGVTIGSANIVLTGGNITGVASVTATGTISAAVIKDSGLTSGRITYATTDGQLTDSSNLTFNGTTLTAGGFTTTGSLSAAATAVSTLSASGVVTVTNTTQSDDTGTGSIVTSGGVAIAKNLNVGGNTIITGNLTVNGTTTTVNSIVETIKDPIIDIGGGLGGIAPTTNDSKDRGITFQYFDTTAKRGFFGYNAQNGRFKYIANASLTGEVATGTLGDIEVGTVYGNIVGGISLTGALALTDSTDSTDQYTGSINTAGGAGIAKRLNVGDSAQFGLNNNNYAKIEGAQSGLPVKFSALGTDTNITIKIVPQGAGLVIIDSTKALTIPAGNTAARPANAPNGSIRFNDQTTQFEGYNGVGWASLGGVKSVDGKTYIIPEETAGSSDDTLYFYTNDYQAGTWTTDRLTIKSKGFKVPTGGDSDRPASPLAGDFRFNTDSGSFEGYASGVWSGLGGVKSVDGLTYIKAEATPGASDDTLYFYSNGSKAATLNETAGLQVNNINLYGRRISATDTNGSLELTGNGAGIVKVIGTGAFQIPSGTTAQRISGSAGYIRYNNETRNLEYWDHVGNVWKTVGSGGGGGGLSDNAGDTYQTFETNGNDEKVIRFYVGAGDPGNASQGSVQIANISKENGLLVSGKISIKNNVIQNITNNEDLIIRATGTGRVVIDGAGSSAGGGNVFATDPVITLNSSFDSGINTYDSGFIVRRGSELNAGFIWSEVGDEFRAINTTNVGTTRGTILETNYATIATASVKLTTETANKVTFTDGNKIVRSLDTGRTAQVDGVMRFNPDAQLGIPYGSIIDRPDTPVDGSLRYNTTTALFEGFAEGGWTNMGIGTGSAPTKQSLIADGNVSSFQLNQTPLSTAGIAVIIDNQILEPDYDYSLTGSGDVLQLLNCGQGTYVPNEGTRIDIRYLSKPAISTVRDYEYVGNGIRTNFATDFAIYAKPDVLVFVNSVYVGPAGYSILGNEVILNTPPTNGFKVNLVHLCTITAPDITTRAESQDDAIAFAIALG